MTKDHKNGIIYRINALRKNRKNIYYENDKQKTYE